MAWKVVDANGCIKAGTGSALLTDPVGVTHGGTGRKTWPQGSLLVADQANSLAPLGKVTNGFKGLSMLSSDQIPRYRDVGDLVQTQLPTIGSFVTGNRRWGIWEAIAQNAVLANIGFPQGTENENGSGTTSTVVDSSSTWRRYTTTLADTVDICGQGSVQSVIRPMYAPRFRVRFRTGTSVAQFKLFFIISNTTPAGATDDNSTMSSYGITYSSTRPDPGFVTFSANGSQQFIGTSAIAAIAANTIYTLEVQTVIASNGSATMICTVNDVSQTVVIPSGIMLANLSMRAAIWIKSNDAAATKFFDLSSMMYQLTAPLVTTVLGPTIRWTGPTSGSQDMSINPTLVLPGNPDGTDAIYTITCDTDMNVTFHGFAGGGGAQDSSNRATGTGGGGGGAGLESGLPATLDHSKTYQVRVGGAGLSHLSASTAGGDTTFKTADGVTTYVALGGGQPASGSTKGTGGPATTGAGAVAGGDGGDGKAGNGDNGTASAGGAGGGAGGGGDTGPGTGGTGGASDAGTGAPGGIAGASGTGFSNNPDYGYGGQGQSVGGGSAVDTVTTPPPAPTNSGYAYSSSALDGFFAPGTYKWASTYTMVDGRETLPSSLLTVAVPGGGFPYAQTNVSTDHSAAPAGACYWNVYRTAIGGSQLKLVRGRMGISNINPVNGAHYGTPAIDGVFDSCPDGRLGRNVPVTPGVSTPGGGGGGGGRGGKITGVPGAFGAGGGGTGSLTIAPYNNTGGNGLPGVAVFKFVS